MRIGYGEDTHRLVEGRKLILGGMEIPFEKGLLGHSDADALTHAIMDALLGALAQPDIGRLFPDSDPAYAGISSLKLLERVRLRMEQNGYALGNLDATILAQRPKLAPYMDAMRSELAAALHCDAAQIGLKASTTEGCGPEGRGECITVRCVCLLEKSDV